MKLHPTLFAAALTLGSLHALAQTQAPGLWEHSFKMKSQDAETEKALADMQKQMAAMPPEQRKQIEQMMASRGMSMGAQGTVVKVCVTKEDVARKAEPQFREGCTQQVLQRSASSMKVKFECTQPRPMSGEGEMSFIGDKAYTGKSTVTSQSNGKTQQMAMEMAGKWLAADCGDVKPRSAPAK
ncbi:MAG: DUF3617 domain-containing protein [Burkholderiaceae bacterium]